MRHFAYLLLALLLFGAAAFAYLVAVQPPPPGLAPAPRGILDLVREWQPILSTLSSVGGLISLLYQLRVWMKKN